MGLLVGSANLPSFCYLLYPSDDARHWIGVPRLSFSSGSGMAQGMKKVQLVPFRPALDGFFASRFYRAIRKVAQTDVVSREFEEAVTAEIDWAAENPSSSALQRQRYRTCWFLLRDLKRVGWRPVWQRNTLYLALPEHATTFHGVSEVQAHKNLVRAAMSHRRNHRIAKHADFIERMESMADAKARGQLPITALIGDGPEIAADLRAAAAIVDRVQRAQFLQTRFKPYLQLVDEKQKCDQTGQLLSEIWRYFRFTWTNPPETTPGRTLLYLIRDGARPNHPVMGIFSLENSPLRIECRDDYVGWTPKSLDHRLIDGKTEREVKKGVEEILHFLEVAIADIDPSRLCTARDISRPTPAIIERLLETAREADAARMREVEKWLKKEAGDDDDHEEQSHLGNISKGAVAALYRRKRAAQLAKLLDAKRVFTGVLKEKDARLAWAQLSKSESGRAAVRSYLIAIKNRHIGTSILELNVCGAVPPYNEILAGKLAALLAISPSVVSDYRNRYGGRASDIASLMKGESVVRPAELAYVGTTSLYAGGSSQYNRLRIPAGTFLGQSQDVRWKELGETKGFGTLHIGPDTVAELERLVMATGTPRANHIFGEGASPKMRTIRAGFEALLESDQRASIDALAKHEMRRIVYGAWIATNGKEYLTGRSGKAHFFFGKTEGVKGTRKVIDYWIDRWLAMRVEHESTIDAVEGFDVESLLVSKSLSSPECEEPLSV